MSYDYARERYIAELAVQRACILTNHIFHGRVKGTVTKDDKSPVTLADYGAQALVIRAVNKNFPDDGIVGEEDADVLRQRSEVREPTWQYVKETIEESKDVSAEIGSIDSVEQMLDTIDLGVHEGGPTGRIWALDPIDGTKGFLRGGQYAVCLGLLVDGRVTVGALACPNLPVDPKNPEGEKGIILSAVRGQGATLKPLLKPISADQPGTPIKMNSPASFADAAFCEGVESGHSNQGAQAAIAKKLGITKESVRMDSQAKYASVARGDGDLYLRLPVSMSYEEKIWDHAAGSLIVEEAGGTVSDVRGNPLDFAVGRTLKKNNGVIAAPKNLHAKVIEAVKEELKAVL